MKCLYTVLFLFLFWSCEKNIAINTEQSQPKLIVDGTIENDKAPVIFLSTSLNYFSAISPQILAASLVSGAKVTISDGTATSELKEYSYELGGGYNLVYYTNDTTNPSQGIKGTEGKTYTLNIAYKNESYFATTTIPVITKKIDSLWWKPAPFELDTSQKVVMMSKVTDPPGYGNYIRYFTSVNGGSFYPGAFSVFDDQVVDGTTYSIQVDQGINRNDPPEQEEYGYFKKGDTVTVKFANIDKTTYDFFRTLEFSYQSVGNPFSSPVKVLGNISNNALGAFSGYGVQYKTLIIPK